MSYTQDFYRGQLDEVRIYSRAISASEVTSIYNFRGDTYTPGIVLPCPAGTYRDSSGTSSGCLQCISQISCGVGGYTGVCDPTSGAPLCALCPSGTYSTGTGMTGINMCTACLAGRYSSAAGGSACQDCPVGQFGTGTGASAATICQMCLAGTYSAGTGASSCSSCPAGTYYTGTGANALSTCQGCAAGTYSTGTGIPVSFPVCASCDGGTYSQFAGSSACAACGAGAFSGLGQSACTLCNAGSYNGATGPARPHVYLSTYRIPPYNYYIRKPDR